MKVLSRNCVSYPSLSRDRCSKNLWTRCAQERCSAYFSKACYHTKATNGSMLRSGFEGNKCVHVRRPKMDEKVKKCAPRAPNKFTVSSFLFVPIAKGSRRQRPRFARRTACTLPRRSAACPCGRSAARARSAVGKYKGVPTKCASLVDRCSSVGPCSTYIFTEESTLVGRSCFDAQISRKLFRTFMFQIVPP